MARDTQFKAPTAEQNASYLRCLQFDALRAQERAAGRSGLLGEALSAEHVHHLNVTFAALERGVCFDREAFGVVQWVA